MKRLLDIQPTRPDRAAHGYVYYRWTTAYMAIVRWTMDRTWLGPVRVWAARRLQSTHHAKVVPAEDARRIVRLDKPIEWRDLERVVPYAVARDIVIESPVTIAIAPCACRAVAQARGERSTSCGPLEQCLYVGDPIASFVAEKQPGARLATAEEALAVIDSAADRGDLHTLWFKDAAAGRMYAICNCCSCCCIGLKAQRNGFAPIAGSGELAVVDPERCTGCANCVGTCAFGAISLAGDNGTALVAEESCMGCGVCVRHCPERAISLVPALGGPEPLPWQRASSG